MEIFIEIPKPPPATLPGRPSAEQIAAAMFSNSESEDIAIAIALFLPIEEDGSD